MKQLITLSLATGLLLSASAYAEEKYDHFPSLEAPDVATALCNIQTYNEKLAALTSAENIDTASMVKIHELTYTLENALARLKTTIAETAQALEEVHLASESIKADVIKKSAKTYFSGTEALLAKHHCQQ
ncbi:hypothetical protein DRW07_13245 [Alteromonas sediminis]|uniref:Uncharacterized protein n=1 Tax=Alteromonas sediminis TaxID=2259342 RepID=A0A3N5YAH2_9ALTE|nr:DUF6746 family protein [Alteromonas sediminis]RPJ65775.1 hypothetical protein DRW07_13245 [Alteromonas sediminis]